MAERIDERRGFLLGLFGGKGTWNIGQDVIMVGVSFGRIGLRFVNIWIFCVCGGRGLHLYVDRSLGDSECSLRFIRCMNYIT